MSLRAAAMSGGGGLSALLLLLGGCAAPDAFHSHVQGCAAGGHTPGSHGFTQCMSSASAAQPSDETRERRRWEARLQREQVEAEARARRERAVAGLVRP